MQIKIENTILADPSLAVGRVGPFSLVLNGQQIVQEEFLFRAASPVYFAREGAGVTLQFSVNRFFSSIRAAEAFLLLHFGAIPREGLVTVTAGESGDTQTLYLRDAVIESVVLPGHRGLCVPIQYTIKGGLWESDVAPEEIPGEPDPEEELPVLRRGKVSIASAATSVAVTFSSALEAAPVVTVTVSRPTGGDNLRATIREDSVSTTGFTVDLSAPAPDGNHKLHYIAVE